MTQIEFVSSNKTQFFNKKYTFTICVGRVWVVIVYFFIEKKQTFNGLKGYWYTNSIFILYNNKYS